MNALGKMTPAEQLRRHSQCLLAHAQQLRKDAELAVERAKLRRAKSEAAVASLREKRRLLAEILNRQPLDRISQGCAVAPFGVRRR